MDMKKIVMAATLLSIVTGGEVSALAAKTTHQSVAKITHVKVTKHKVTGYTTAKSHITLMKLKHGEKASATANKKGKFTVKVKKNNLSKLKFKIKATKAGLKTRTYTHKVKKAVQAIDNGVITETPASTTPAKPDDGKKPEKKPVTSTNSGNHQVSSQPQLSKPTEDIKTVKEHLEIAKQNYLKVKNQTQQDVDAYNTANGKARDLYNKVSTARENFVNDSSTDKTETQGKLTDAKKNYEKYTTGNEYNDAFNKNSQAEMRLRKASDEVFRLGNILHKLQPNAPFEGNVI